MNDWGDLGYLLFLVVLFLLNAYRKAVKREREKKKQREARPAGTLPGEPAKGMFRPVAAEQVPPAREISRESHPEPLSRRHGRTGPEYPDRRSTETSFPERKAPAEEHHPEPAPSPEREWIEDMLEEWMGKTGKEEQDGPLGQEIPPEPQEPVPIPQAWHDEPQRRRQEPVPIPQAWHDETPRRHITSTGEAQPVTQKPARTRISQQAEAAFALPEPDNEEKGGTFAGQGIDYMEDFDPVKAVIYSEIFRRVC